MRLILKVIKQNQDHFHMIVLASSVIAYLRKKKSTPKSFLSCSHNVLICIHKLADFFAVTLRQVIENVLFQSSKEGSFTSFQIEKIVFEIKDDREILYICKVTAEY